MYIENLNISYKIVNSLGLLFDIAGVCLIWHFGVPDKVPKDVGMADRYKKGALEKYTRWSKWGLALLILGFVFQVVSNFLR